MKKNSLSNWSHGLFFCKCTWLFSLKTIKQLWFLTEKNTMFGEDHIWSYCKSVFFFGSESVYLPINLFPKKAWGETSWAAFKEETLRKFCRMVPDEMDGSWEVWGCHGSNFSSKESCSTSTKFNPGDVFWRISWALTNSHWREMVDASSLWTKDWEGYQLMVQIFINLNHPTLATVVWSSKFGRLNLESLVAFS